MLNTPSLKHLENLLASPSTASIILKYIEDSTSQRLPSAGVVAGQSVASAFYKLANLEINPIINDVDIFAPQGADFLKVSEDINLIDTPNSSSIPFRSFGGRVSFFHNLSLDFDEYNGVTTMITKPLYSVLTSIEQDSLNILPLNMSSLMTEITGMDKRFMGNPIFKSTCLNLNNSLQFSIPQKKVAMIIAGFDMNCVQIGIDLETKSLFYSRHFIEFCATKELKIVTMHTPIQSLIRFHVKKEQLGVFGNSSLQFEMVRDLVEYSQLSEPIVTLRVQQFLKNCAYFDFHATSRIIKSLNLGIDPSILKAVGSGLGNIPLIIGSKYFNKISKIPQFHLYFDLIKHPFKSIYLVLAKHKKEAGRPNLVSLHQSGYVDFVDVYTTNYFPLSKSVIANKSLVFNVIDELNEKEKSDSFIVNRIYLNMKISNPNSYFNSSSKEDIISLVKLWNMHPEVGVPLSQFSISDQIRFLKYMSHLFKKSKIGEAGWGRREFSSPTFIKEFLDEISSISVSDFSSFVISFSKKYPSLELAEEVRDSVSPALFTVCKGIIDCFGGIEPLYLHKLNIPSVIQEVSIKEIDTPNGLTIEGHQMRHCVGGYSGQVKNGRARIISFQDNLDSSRGGRATAEWRIRYDSISKSIKIDCIQIRAYLNKDPSNRIRDINQEAMRQVSEYINANLADLKHTLIKELNIDLDFKRRPSAPYMTAEEDAEFPF